jgi:hypothetical protein
MQLMGVLESVEFYGMFKQCLMKALVFYFNKLIRMTKNYELNR